MRFYNHINELLKINPKLITREIKKRKHYKYTNNIEIVDREGGKVTVDVDIRQFTRTRTWDIDFQAESKGHHEVFSHVDIKETIKILNVVMSAVDDFIKTEKPYRFDFIEATSSEHMAGERLYKKFAKMITHKYPYEVEIKGDAIFKFERTE